MNGDARVNGRVSDMVSMELVRMMGLLHESMKMHLSIHTGEYSDENISVQSPSLSKTESGVQPEIQVRKGQSVLFDIDAGKRLIHIGTVSPSEREELLTIFQHFVSRMKQESGVQYTVV